MGPPVRRSIRQHTLDIQGFPGIGALLAQILAVPGNRPKGNIYQLERPVNRKDNNKDNRRVAEHRGFPDGYTARDAAH